MLCGFDRPEVQVGGNDVGDRRCGHGAFSLDSDQTAMALKSAFFGLLATTAGLVSRFTTEEGASTLIVCSSTKRIYTVASPAHVECLGVKGDRILAVGSYGASPR